METPQDTLRKIYGNSVEIRTTRSVTGGDINEAYLLGLSDGTCVFMKKHRGSVPEFFLAEADGLSAIRQTDTIHVPEVQMTEAVLDFLEFLLDYYSGNTPD